MKQTWLQSNAGAVVVAGLSLAAVMITLRQQWSEPKQWVGIAMFTLVAGVLGRAISMFPVRKGTLRLDKISHALITEVRGKVDRIDLQAPVDFNRFMVAPNIPYSNGLTAVVLSQGPVEVRFAWPLRLREQLEPRALPSSPGAWITDSRGRAIGDHLTSLLSSRKAA